MLRYAATACRRHHPRQLPIQQGQCLAPSCDQRAQMRQAVAGIAGLVVQRVAQPHQLAQPDAGLDQRAHEAQPLQRLGVIEAVAAVRMACSLSRKRCSLPFFRMLSAVTPSTPAERLPLFEATRCQAWRSMRGSVSQPHISRQASLGCA